MLGVVGLETVDEERRGADKGQPIDGVLSHTDCEAITLLLYGVLDREEMESQVL